MFTTKKKKWKLKIYIVFSFNLKLIGKKTSPEKYGDFVRDQSTLYNIMSSV